MRLPFNRPFATGRELDYMAQAIANGHLSGNGPFTRRCQELLRERLGCEGVLLTHSATAALELSALLLGLEPGDEAIMPSFTFVTTASAFALRRAVPVFVDIREDTLNLDEELVEAAVGPRTRVIVPVHYAGVACEMGSLLEIGRRHELPVVEDAAQGLGSSYRGRPLGTLGALGALSFHETKNAISGEGGALLVNDPDYIELSEILWEKGTDRGRFFRGEIDRYTWQEVGSSFLPSDLLAAFLLAQLESIDEINAARSRTWQAYHEALEPAEQAGLLRRPRVPSFSGCNGHLYYVLLRPGADRARVIDRLRQNGINTVFHYVPLHDSPAGRRVGRVSGSMAVTEALAPRLLRLPLWVGMGEDDVARAAEQLVKALRST